MPDEFETGLIVADRLGRVEIEQRAAVGVPSISTVMKDGRGGPEIADGFDVFHAAAFDRLEADRHGDKCRDLSATTVANVGHVVLEVAIRPA